MDFSKTQKRFRNSTEDEDINIISEASEDSDFQQCRQRLNKKAYQAKAKLSSPKETEKSLIGDTEKSNKKQMKNQSLHLPVDLFTSRSTNHPQPFCSIPAS